MITTAALDELASYVPALIIRRVAADEHVTMAPAAERFPAAVLIADLSGFTALTEHLAQHSPAGAEELTSILDLYFGHLVGVVMSHGGDVVKFAGDGLLALWYGPEPLEQLAQRTVQCGLAVQMMMAPDAWGSLDGAAPPPPLKVRIGVGAGPVTIMHVGGVFGRWELLITGAALTQAGRAETEARSGEVVIAAEAWPLVAAACIGAPLPSGAMSLQSLVDYLPMRALTVPQLAPTMADTLRAYIPKAILARIDAGQTNWLAEQRRVTVLFVNLPDLSDDTPLHQAQAMMRALQTSLYRYEGSVTRLGTDAKGPTLVAALGLPPLAHEDDPERGVMAALAISQALAELGCRVAIGITTGRALCGAVGGQTRREYTMMGPMVNRSARLMQAALGGGGVILCDEATQRAARARLAFDALPPLTLKGVADPVPIFAPATAATLPGPAPAPAHALFGREREQQVIADQIAGLAQSGHGGALIIEGEAGIGKSALLAYTRSHAAEYGLTTLAGAGSPVDQPPYAAWRHIFAELLALLAPTAASDPAALAGLLAELDLASFAPLLGAVLPLSLPDTPRTAPLAGQVRADNTRDLLVRLIEHTTSRRPLLLTFEDAQWLDASSWALLQTVAERVNRLLIAVAARPMDTTPAAFQRLAYMPGSARLQLRGLSPEAVRSLLVRRLAVASIPDQLCQLISTRSQGNPFVAEELLDALRESGAVTVVDGLCRLNSGELTQLAVASGLPDTVEGLITSRIDRLMAAPQLTLKVASVIGPLFTLSALAALHPVEHERDRLVEQLFALQQAGLVVIEAFEPELTYTFKHAVGCEVAYNLMSFGQRRRLHRQLAESYEAGTLELTLSAAQLAHHWRQAEEPQRTMLYLARAGEEALRGGAYGEAARFLAEALAIADTPHAPVVVEQPAARLTRARWERQLGEAYHSLGRLIESRILLERAVGRLGYPVQKQPGPELLALAGELLRQARALLLPVPLRLRNGGEAPGEAARAYALLAQLAYYDGQLLTSAYAALRGLNLAEQAGLSAALAGAYGATQIAAGALPPLARIYRRRAQVTAAQLDHMPTHGWIAEAQALHDIGHARWRRAQGAIGVGLAVAAHLGDQRRRAECVAARCLIEARQGRFQVALVGCDELQLIGLQAGDVQVRAWGVIGAAENLLCLGEDARAETLLGEAEALLAENLGGARAEEVWVYGLLARAALRRKAYDITRALAGAAAGLVGRVPPAAIYVLGGHAAVAESYLGLWEALPADREDSRRAMGEVARGACRSLNRFALVFPVARPAALTWQGLHAWLSGRAGAASRRWAAAAALARRYAMPYDEAQALFQAGRHTPGPEGRFLLEAAAARFAALGCVYDLGRVREALG